MDICDHQPCGRGIEFVYGLLRWLRIEVGPSRVQTCRGRRHAPDLADLGERSMSAGPTLAQQPDQIGQRSSQATHRPRGNDVELSAGHALEQRIQPWPLVAPLGATDPFVTVEIATTAQPSRLAASCKGCSWFSAVWPLSLVETRTYSAARPEVAIAGSVARIGSSSGNVRGLGLRDRGPRRPSADDSCGNPRVDRTPSTLRHVHRYLP